MIKTNMPVVSIGIGLTVSNQITLAQMAEPVAHDFKVAGSNPAWFLMKSFFSKLKSYCLLQHMIIIGWLILFECLFLCDEISF